MHLNLLKHLLSSNQRTLKQTLRNFLIAKGYKVIEKNGFLYAEGNIPVCLVAHLDTVFKTEPENIYYDKEKRLKNEVTQEAIKLFAEDVSKNVGTQSNVRGSKEYRTHLIKVLVERGLEELGGNSHGN